MVCPVVDPFAQIALLENVPCIETLVWLEASGFRCSINTGSSPGLLQYPAVALCHEELAALALQDGTLYTLQQSTDGVDVGMGQLKVLDLVLGGGCLGYPASSPTLPK